MALSTIFNRNSGCTSEINTGFLANLRYNHHLKPFSFLYSNYIPTARSGKANGHKENTADYWVSQTADRKRLNFVYC